MNYITVISNIEGSLIFLNVQKNNAHDVEFVKVSMQEIQPLIIICLIDDNKMQVRPQVTNKSRCGLWTSLTHLNFFDNFKFHPNIFKKLMNARNEYQICK